jgi:hypothetical protein
MDPDVTIASASRRRKGVRRFQETIGLIGASRGERATLRTKAVANERPSNGHSVDQASHGSGIRNADHGTPSSKQILHRPGQPDPVASGEGRPPEGQRGRKDVSN